MVQISPTETERNRSYCLYCYKEMEHILGELVVRCVNEECALYMKDQFHGETHD